MPDDAFFPELFVSWEEITPDEVAAFESALNGARNEADMQGFIERHPRMLIQQIGVGRAAWLIPQKRLGSEHVTDFLVAQKASSGLVWWAVELERPQAKMFNKNGDPSSTLNHALRQISDWRDWLSNNRDYATRPPWRSGLGLIDIDPELEGLIIIGRDADIDESTVERRRRLMRERRVEIETYDWLLYQARERLAAWEERIRTGARSFVASMIDAFPAGWRQEQPAEEAVKEVFGATFGMSTTLSAARDIDWEGIDLAPDYPDVVAPLKIVYARGQKLDELLQSFDWEDWIDNVVRDLDYNHSLLVTEKTPAQSLQEVLTPEREGVWYAARGAHRFLRVDVLVHVPLTISYEEKRTRVAVAREVLLRSIPDPALEREKELAREREAERKVQSLSLTPGDVVTHDKFGRGTVLSTSGSGTKAEATIDFGEGLGIKCLVLCHAPIKRTEKR